MHIKKKIRKLKEVKIKIKHEESERETNPPPPPPPPCPTVSQREQLESQVFQIYQLFATIPRNTQTLMYRIVTFLLLHFSFRMISFSQRLDHVVDHVKCGCGYCFVNARKPTYCSEFNNDILSSYHFIFDAVQSGVQQIVCFCRISFQFQMRIVQWKNWFWIVLLD